MHYNVVCIDETGVISLELSKILKNFSIRILLVYDEFEAISVLADKRNKVNAIVWAVNSPEMDDYLRIKNLKTIEELKQLPVIVVSRFTGKNYILKAVECGAVEFIAKPYEEDLVVRKFCRILGISSDHPVCLLDEDIITFNFQEMLSKEFKAASRGSYPLSILLISVVRDNPNELPDSDIYDLIPVVGRVLKAKLRETDSCFQYGSNNLIVLLPFTGKDNVTTVEDKILNLLGEHTVIQQKITGYRFVIVSVSYPDDGKIKDKLLEKLEDSFKEYMEKQIASGGSNTQDDS